jgi:protein TonB
MTKIKNVTLEFACQEKLDDKLFCHKCAHRVIDFTTKTNDELQEEINKSIKPVCGIFKKSQLSDQFLKYAAATFIATSLTIPVIGQEEKKGDSLLKSCEKVETENEEGIFFGVMLETQAEPVGGYKRFYEAIANSIKYPPGLNEKGRLFVELSIDTAGRVTNIKLIKGFNEYADKEAVRGLTELNYSFKPGKQRGKAIESKLIVPVTIDPEKYEKR